MKLVSNIRERSEDAIPTQLLYKWNGVKNFDMWKVHAGFMGHWKGVTVGKNVFSL